MEETADLLKAVNTEVEESKRVLQDLHNDIKSIHALVSPDLLKQAQELRTARMTVVNEVRESLQSLRDVRKFFLESDYELEMQRLERFVAVCRELQQLKASGVMDAVCDSALRLAIQESGR